MPEYLPRGRYLAREVGLLAGVSGDQIGQWARRRYIRPSVELGPPHVYSFEDIEESIAVHELRERGAPYSSIRRAIEHLRQLEGRTDWPLSSAYLEVGGRTIAEVEAEDDDAMVLRVFDISKHEDHLLLDLDDLHRIRAELGRGGWAVRQLPKLEHIEVNPDRLSGRPTIRGRRLAAEDVAVAAQQGDVIRLREDYELTDREIKDAVDWWRVVSEFERAA
jgi:uncharacterized protein (DUF433 family)